MSDEHERLREAQDRAVERLRPLSESARAHASAVDAYRLSESARAHAQAVDGLRGLFEDGDRHGLTMRAAAGALDEFRRASACGLASVYREEVGRTAKLLADANDPARFSAFDGIGRLARDMAGPLEDARRLGLFGSLSAVRQELERATALRAEYESRFRLPEINEVGRLARELEEHRDALTAFRASTLPGQALRAAMEGMRSPWLDARDRIGSAFGFAGVQGIGAALRASQPYDPVVGAALRGGLGDWREPLSWPERIFREPTARFEFYVERGFNPRLTDFPAAAIEEGQALAGLRQPAPPIVSEYDGGAAQEGNEDPADPDGADFARNRAAFDRLQRFETQFRRFMDARMTAAFGPDWAKQQVPGEILTNWRRKKDTARKKGERDHPLIAYADFTDYILIIERGDNWKTVFEPVFLRKEDVRESFQRLFPVRICTAHARFITAEDEFLLRAETFRVERAMRAAPDP